MSRYNDLSAAYSSQEQATRDYWNSLQLKASQITAGFPGYLGLDSLTYQDFDGKDVRYVQLRNHGAKEEAHFMRLEGDNLAINFAVAVTLEPEPGAFPKSVVQIALKIGRTDEAFEVWSDEVDIDAQFAFDSNNYDALYEQMYARLMEYLSTRPVLERSR